MAGRSQRPAIAQVWEEPRKGDGLIAFLQDRPVRHRRGVKPLVVGALACGAVLVTAPGAMASHVMANGMLCPHAAGDPVPGEAAPTVNPSGSASSAPLAAPGSAQSAPAKPAAKPSSQPKAQQPASQAQAQRPATSQATAQSQAQRPAIASVPASRTATVPVPGKTRSTTPAPRQVPIVAAVQTPALKAERPVAERLTVPAAPDPLRLARGGDVNPIASLAVVDAGQPASPSLGTLLLALLALVGTVAVATLVLVKRRMVRDARSAAVSLTFAERMDAAIEAELQAMILETRERMLPTPDHLEDVDDSRELSATH
jgi:hypothetical protein